MIVYNVTAKVDKDAAGAWVKWMSEEHIPQLLDTGLFTETKLCKLLEQDETEGITFVAQYYCKNMEQYNRYIDEYAVIMRGRALQAFGNKFTAFRTLMEII